MLEIPAKCPKIEKIEDRKVFIISEDKCDLDIGRVEADIEIMDGIDIYLDGKFWKRHTLASFDTGIVDNIKKYEGKINIENKYVDLGKAEAQKAYEFYKSDTFQGKIAQETERLKKDVFAVEGYADLHSGSQKENMQEGKLSQNERLYVFISSSIPMETLRAYSSAIGYLNDPNIVFIMRGFIGGMTKIQPTIDFSINILKKEEDCVLSIETKCAFFSANYQVDPLLFRRYNIEKVPAFVYVPKIEVIDTELSEGDTQNAKNEDHYLIYGDARMDYIVEMLHKETSSKSLKTVLTNLLSGFYQSRGNSGR